MMQSEIKHLGGAEEENMIVKWSGKSCPTESPSECFQQSLHYQNNNIKPKRAYNYRA